MESKQGYLDAAPIGINARFCWSLKGGYGESGVKFIDIEQGWILNHNSISVNTFSSTGINVDHSRDHGVAVLGIIMMDGKQDGIVGIVPKVKGHVISTWRPSAKMD